jgi:ABC-2 type transport system ATP-binding protein
MPAVELEGLEKRYGSLQALAGLALRVKDGTIHGFVGPNGSGKTTTMRICVGLLRADAGTARVLGADPWHGDPAVRGRVGYLPSAPGLYGRMRGGQLLDHLAELGGRTPSLRAAACDAVRLSDAELAREVRGYSRGMRQKLGIVQALQHDPDLAILDEPTEGLDPPAQDGLYALLADRREAGRTILFSSHVLSEVEALCDDVSIVREGRIVAAGTLAELRRALPRRVTVELASAEAAAALALDGAEVLERRGARVELAWRGELAPLLAALAGLAPRDVTIGQPGLDEVFRGYYEGDAEARR